MFSQRQSAKMGQLADRYRSDCQEERLVCDEDADLLAVTLREPADLLMGMLDDPDRPS